MVKVGIPESATHYKGDVFEEISVPHSPGQPPLTHKIPISDLEDIIKVGGGT